MICSMGGDLHDCSRLALFGDSLGGITDDVAEEIVLSRVVTVVESFEKSTH